MIKRNLFVKYILLNNTILKENYIYNKYDKLTITNYVCIVFVQSSSHIFLYT